SHGGRRSKKRRRVGSSNMMEEGMSEDSYGGVERGILYDRPAGHDFDYYARQQ
ncbi:hypothetical protein Pmar_PMAR013636, partial [Perkinsus marinus ATCC 50983]